jgi:hypothetical protein
MTEKTGDLLDSSVALAHLLAEDRSPPESDWSYGWSRLAGLASFYERYLTPARALGINDFWL